MTLRNRSLAILLCALGLSMCALAHDIPSSPEGLAYPELSFRPPAADQASTTLSGGVACFVVTDHRVPVVDLTLHFRCGSFGDPAGKEGLAGLAFELMRSGGAGDLASQDLLRELEALAINTSASVGRQRSELSLSCLREDLPRAIQLLSDIVRRPRLEATRLELLRAQTLDGMRHRFDSPDSVGRTYLTQVLYPGHPAARMETGASVQSVTVDNIRDFLTTWVQPAALVVTIGGDVDKAEADAVLAPLLSGWETTSLPERAAPPQPEPLPPGVYVVDMPAESVGIHGAHLGFDQREPRYDPESYATRLANLVLGGGFDSRLMSRIRVREGLAYDVYMTARSEVGFPGIQDCYAGVPVAAAAYAASVMREEVEGYLATGPDEAELARAKQSLFGYWVGFFESPASVAEDYGRLLIDGQPLDYYTEWFGKSEACDVAQVTEVGRARIRPSEFRWLLVGPAEQLVARDEQRGVGLEDLGPVRVLSLGDPLDAVSIPPAP